jgi:signal transduction histidine kinase/ligand-binding sensor domain-containing protein/DNA-binding response OmpR family regulator
VILRIIIKYCGLSISLISTVLIFLFLTSRVYSQSDGFTIEHISVNQGLSNDYVRCIFQDKEGYLWFSTQTGIDRYDGYSFLSYNHNPEDINSFNNAYATFFYEDKEGILWIGTFHGLERFDRLTNTFSHFLPDNSDKTDEYVNYVWHMIEDKQGTFWVSTGKGILKFDKTSGIFTKSEYENNDLNDANFKHNYGTVYIDKAGTLWYGNSAGLFKLNFNTGKFISYYNDPDEQEKDFSTASRYQICSIAEDNSENLWLGTTNGIIKFDRNQNSFNNYLPEPEVHTPLHGNHVNKILFDQSGRFWLGTVNGLYNFDPESETFTYQSNLGNILIIELYIDRSGAFWIPTYGSGAYKLIQKKSSLRRYFPNGITNLIDGKKDIIWVDTSAGSWLRFDIRTDQIIPHSFGKDILFAANDSGSMWFNKTEGDIYKLEPSGKITNYYDPSGNKFKVKVITHFQTADGIWFGDWKGSIYFLDFRTNYVSEKVRTQTWVTAIHEDMFGLIWAANNMGKLICYDQKKDTLIEYTSDIKNPRSISGKQIFGIHEDKKGRLWFATNAGLNLLERSTNTFIHFIERDGLAGNVVYSILEDDDGNLWLDADKGISKFDPETNQFKNYDDLQEISSSGWYYNLACKTSSGEMFFGRSKGLIRFHPDNIKENKYIPSIVITSFLLFDKSIPFQKEISLSHDQNFLSFEFSALSYVSSERNQYAYKMEGVDEDWVYSGTRRYASYPNLPPGNYTFRVKGSNNDGVWNEEGTSLLIIISPPWWKTTWAYITYGFIFTIILYGIRKYELNRAKLKNQIKLDEAVLKEREETDKMKSRFFANISHEFRTPLTLILGPAEKINRNSSGEEIEKQTGVIKRNAARLLNLVNQLLDLSKLEAGKLQLQASKGNIVSFVRGMTMSFESLAERKDIKLKVTAERDDIELYFDRDKMAKILANLLSNAFKFTIKGGEITVALTLIPSPIGRGMSKGQGEGEVQIRVTDTGIGISEEELPKLFDRFYQVDSSQTREHEGTGIGLALTKELVELHHGKIYVKSKVGAPDKVGTGGSEFIVELPVGKDHLRDDEIVEVSESQSEVILIPQVQEKKLTEDIAEITMESSSSVKSRIQQNDIEIDKDKTIILVVEDNADVREYIKDSLGSSFTIEMASNGEQGVKKALEIIPDLIISDVMMPKMDGNELARRIRNDERTSHIPLILLTAKSEQESKIEGLETGADDYLTKPFDTKELLVRIKNLIDIRRKLQEKFSGEKIIARKVEKKLSILDERFLNKVLEAAEKHLSEETFSIEDFGSEVGMGRVQLHRKLKALTGKSPSLYLRSVRLAKAKNMIEEKLGNISEIAYSTGFSSPAYFTACFKEEFGYPPSEVLST